MLFLCYPGCSTCAKAKAFLAAKQLDVTFRNIKTQPPTVAELQSWHTKSGLPLARFFNTSGGQYRALGLKEKLPGLSEAQQLALLATDGMLVRRPILVQGDTVLVGFRPDEWGQAL